MSAIEAASSTMACLTEAAPAKVNLALHVTGRRADGYHLIDTLAVFAGFGDRVTVEPAASDRFAVSGPYARDLPEGADNLVIRARDMVREIAGDVPCPPVSIALEKNLPPASGLGGGSSDAAATIRALVRHWRLEPAGLAGAALSLGADLPMCLAARPLLAQGIGERITSLPRFPELHLVLVNPGVEVATPGVFSALGRHDNSGLPPLPSPVDHASLTAWLAGTRNDLEKAAIGLAPEIGDTLAELTRSGASFARMSGSGATCFGIFGDARSALRAAEETARRQPGWFVKATTSGSVP